MLACVFVSQKEFIGVCVYIDGITMEDHLSMRKIFEKLLYIEKLLYLLHVWRINYILTIIEFNCLVLKLSNSDFSESSGFLKSELTYLLL